ncbi:hypothetical protein NE237_005491 [Protea cynaroides]|uniref:Uncharacterized protein n=1 Tax=Protea cynaroides TaxID=273540 RepID=A0A9Q0KKU3_9MAGN|nr:hypothetical protein NE237_005491 [Protea cynaroides]
MGRQQGPSRFGRPTKLGPIEWTYFQDRAYLTDQQSSAPWSGKTAKIKQIWPTNKARPYGVDILPRPSRFGRPIKLGPMHTIVLRRVEPTATFGIDHDTKSGYETAPVSRSTTLRQSASNRNGAGDALAARARRREEAALDQTKSGAHKALRGLRFISN